jgi:hypothetical protein
VRLNPAKITDGAGMFEHRQDGKLLVVMNKEGPALTRVNGRKQQLLLPEFWQHAEEK